MNNTYLNVHNTFLIFTYLSTSQIIRFKDAYRSDILNLSHMFKTKNSIKSNQCATILIVQYCRFFIDHQKHYKVESNQIQTKIQNNKSDKSFKDINIKMQYKNCQFLHQEQFFPIIM